VCAIEAAEAAGVEQIWLGQVSETADALSVIAAAALRTSNIRIGTSIVPIYPLRPLALAQQAATVSAFAPGRLRLGVGPSTRARVKRVYGLEMIDPLAYLEEYVTVLRAALWDGRVDHHGRSIAAQVILDQVPHLPILTSALGESAFCLAGRIADGAISWNCPPAYLLETARPALIEGALQTNRPAPPLVAHMCVALTNDRDAAFAAGRDHLAFYVKLPFYAAMFAAAGYPIGPDQQAPDALVEQLVVMGDDAAVAARLIELLDSGLDELLVTNLPVGDRTAIDQRLFSLVGRL
jgi:alkanesulfonate monooxygenase SsuD/methylene tetrahydromethanopterin reductase-like flavin-dependent oxidoreductase (luciferase family)